MNKVRVALQALTETPDDSPAGEPKRHPVHRFFKMAQRQRQRGATGDASVRRPGQPPADKPNPDSEHPARRRSNFRVGESESLGDGTNTRYPLGAGEGGSPDEPSFSDLVSQIMDRAGTPESTRFRETFENMLEAMNPDYRDFDYFLQDNPGVWEAILGWVAETGEEVPEWKEGLAQFVANREGDEAEELDDEEDHAQLDPGSPQQNRNPDEDVPPGRDSVHGGMGR